MRLWLIMASLMMAGCQRDQRPPAPTAQEAAQLDNAEADLNSLGNDEGPPSGDADPSGNVN